MKWTQSIRSKLNISLLMFGVMGVVLLINLKEGHDSSELRKAFVSIYDDRLVVGGYILKLSEKLHEINEVLENQNNPDEIKVSTAGLMLQEIKNLNLLYGKTELTEQEAEYFLHFTRLTVEISEQLDSKEFGLVRGNIAEALLDLHLLSDIQLTEAEKIMHKTDKLLQFGSLTSQFELAVLIIVGLMIQILLFSSRYKELELGKHVGNLN